MKVGENFHYLFSAIIATALIWSLYLLNTLYHFVDTTTSFGLADNIEANL